MENIFYFFLVICILSFLVFIHELGHYIAARKEGMEVQVFSIGFGKPVFTWRYQGVLWQICWLPFGGYVKIAGMGEQDSKDKNKNSFYNKSPWSRARVAIAGPLMNIIFAFVALSCLFFMGGREKKFSEFSSYIGWIDPKSDLYAQGIRPGDAILSYDGVPFKDFSNHISAAILSKKNIQAKILKTDSLTGDQTIVHRSIAPIKHPRAIDKDLMTTGVLSPASYLIYDKISEHILPYKEGSPIQDSGILYGDRIVWIDGKIIYSSEQLMDILNSNKSFVTIKRGEEVKQVRIPRVLIRDMHLDSYQKSRFIDWQYEANTGGDNSLYYAFPYILDEEGKVISQTHLFDLALENEIFDSKINLEVDTPLLAGDQIIAVDGQRVGSAFEIFLAAQKHQVHMIVAREANPDYSVVDVNTALHEFHDKIPFKEITQIAASIGTSDLKTEIGTAVLLNPIIPRPYREFNLTSKDRESYNTETAAILQQIAAITDSQLRERQMEAFEKSQNRAFLGFTALQDRRIVHNPAPLKVMSDIFIQIKQTLSALFQGNMSPKWLSGPVGMVNIVKYQASLGIKEALFWVALISVQLGLLNLLPFPIFDGGHICLSILEGVTGKKLHNKRILEWINTGFVILLVSLSLYILYHDVARMILGMFS